MNPNTRNRPPENMESQLPPFVLRLRRNKAGRHASAKRTIDNQARLFKFMERDECIQRFANISRAIGCITTAKP